MTLNKERAINMPNTETREDIQVYELGYLILPSISEDALPGVVQKIKEVVSKAGGVEFDGEEPFKIPLAYTMTKTIGASRYVVSDAYLGWMKFELEPSQALAVKSGIEKIDEVLRSLLIKAPRESAFTFAKAKAEEALKEAEKRAEEKEAKKEAQEASSEEAPSSEKEVGVE